MIFFCEKYEDDLLKNIIIIAGYNLNNFTPCIIIDHEIIIISNL
jgi:hypothetical protein